jgi:dissimilatory sulfite reductase (desulfoviridin) alpha/beta subunit
VKAITLIQQSPEIDLKKCKNCDACIKACPFDAIYEKRRGIAILVGGRGPHFMHDRQTGETRLAEKLIDFISGSAPYRLQRISSGF